MIFEGANYNYMQNLNSIHHSISWVMVFDTILKLLTFGVNRYFGYNWRRFEFIIALLGLIDFALDIK